MSGSTERSVWAGGAAYEPYVGRWSRLVAREFVAWLAVPSDSSWLDVGCGTGALAETILTHARPSAVLGVDPSAGYLAVAREQVRDPRVRFELGDARDLTSFGPSHYHAVASALVLNFIPDLPAAMAEMKRAARTGGVVAGYVWDYAGRMELMRHFWDAVIALHPEDAGRDEGRRFPICQPERLREMFHHVGLEDVEVRSIDVPTHFRDFDDYWSPFLGGQFPAPDYAMSLDEGARTTLREHIRAKLPFASDGSIPLIARAFAVRGTKG